MFYNLLPKSEEYSHAWGFAPLLIYCLLKGIRVNILKLITDYMASEHLLIPNRHLTFQTLITRLLKQLKFNLSAERSIEPSVDINSTLLKRKRALAPQSPPIFLLLPLDPLQPFQSPLIRTQLSLLSFGSMI